MPLLALALAAANPAFPAMDDALHAECARVAKVHPLLIIAVMAEGPVDCGDPESGVPVDCAADETPEQKKAHALRWELRKYQEAGYKAADAACRDWRAYPKSDDMRAIAASAIAEARARDKATAVPAAAAPGS